MTSPSSRSITHDTMNRRPNLPRFQRASHAHAARLQPNLARLRRAPSAHLTRLQRICSVAGKARRTQGFLRRSTAFRRIRCAEKGSMREWEAAAQRRDTGDWRSGSAGPLQGQGHWFKSGIAHQRSEAGPDALSGPACDDSTSESSSDSVQRRPRLCLDSDSGVLPGKTSERSSRGQAQSGNHDRLLDKEATPHAVARHI